jgi:hypothetical protein
MIPEYKQSTVNKIKKVSKELSTLNDEAVAYLYSYWSEERYCAGWATATAKGIKSFIEWAITPPYIERLERFRKEVNLNPNRP